MPISPFDAELALKDIADTARSSATLYGYRLASPHLILWGMIWAVGYGSDFLLGHHPFAWPALTVLGACGSGWLVWRTRSGGVEGGAWRYGSTALAICSFIAAIFA